MKLTITFLFALTFFNTVGQQQPAFTIAAKETNVLYCGVSNPLEIKVKNLNSTQLRVKASDGSAVWPARIRSAKTTTKHFGNFTAHPKCNTPEITISVYNSETDTLIGTQIFQTKKIPDATIYLLNPNQTDTIPKDSLSKLDQLQLKILNLPFELKARAYEITSIINGKSFYTKNETFSPALKSELVKSKKGSSLVFKIDRVVYGHGSVKHPKPYRVVVW